MTEDPGYVLVVGQPFPLGDIPPDTMGFYPDNNSLVLGLASPRPDEIEAFHSRDGWVEFALVPLGPLLVTLMRFPDSDWADSPWAHFRAPEETESNAFEPDKPVGDSERYMVGACLVDSDTNIVLGLRAFTLSPHYSKALYRELVDRLSKPPMPRDTFLQLVNEYQARYPNPKQLLDRALVRCKAGLP